jgi:hypothetical protein
LTTIVTIYINVHVVGVTRWSLEGTIMHGYFSTYKTSILGAMIQVRVGYVYSCPLFIAQISKCYCIGKSEHQTRDDQMIAPGHNIAQEVCDGRRISSLYQGSSILQPYSNSWALNI